MRQVGRQVRHHVAADELPPEVIVLALAVLALVRVSVLLEGAAGCGQRGLSAPQKPCWDDVLPPKTQGDPRHPPTCTHKQEYGPVCHQSPISPIQSPHQRNELAGLSSRGGLSRGSRMQLPALLPGGRSPNRGFLPRNRHFAAVVT